MMRALPVALAGRSVSFVALLVIVEAIAFTPRPIPAQEEPAALLSRIVDQPFEDVVLAVVDAINGQNFRITGENDIGMGLRKRGYDDFPNYRIIHFCNLELARKGLLVDMRLGAIMPCRVAIYEEGGHVVVVLPSAQSVLAPLKNPDLAAFQSKLEAVYRAILDEVTY